jgi:heme/copper-type cytochrome/quinol oxidase subunit 2
MSIVEILTHQAMARFRNSRDEYTIETNNSLVVYWSVFQSILIVVCGCIQVYFVKRLFTTSTGNRSSASKH